MTRMNNPSGDPAGPYDTASCRLSGPAATRARSTNRPPIDGHHHVCRVCGLATLWITKWAASRPNRRPIFYTAGGGITGFQNGLAIAGDAHVPPRRSWHFRCRDGHRL